MTSESRQARNRQRSADSARRRRLGFRLEALGVAPWLIDRVLLRQAQRDAETRLRARKGVVSADA